MQTPALNGGRGEAGWVRPMMFTRCSSQLPAEEEGLGYLLEGVECVSEICHMDRHVK